VPYEPLPKTDVTLPKRQKPRGYKDPNLPAETHPETLLTGPAGQAAQSQRRSPADRTQCDLITHEYR